MWRLIQKACFSHLTTDEVLPRARQRYPAWQTFPSSPAYYAALRHGLNMPLSTLPHHHSCLAGLFLAHVPDVLQWVLGTNLLTLVKDASPTATNQPEIQAVN
eukprot:579612-Pelagomonas_calceolata.AAC.3